MHACVSFLLMSLMLAAPPSIAAVPAAGVPKPFDLPQGHRFTLGNGMRVTLVGYGDLPEVTTQVVMRTGHLDEGEHTWLAGITAEMLKEGSAHRDGREIAAAVAALGGNVDIGVGADQTFVTGRALSEFGPELVALLAEMVREPAFPEEAFARVRGDFQRRLAIGRSQPQQLALAAFLESLYPEHPYGRHFPDEGQLDHYTVDDVRAFFEANSGARRTHLYVAGRFDTDSVERAIRDAFADWRPGPPPLIDPPDVTAEPDLVLIDRPGAPQSTLHIGLPVVDPGHDDHFALSAMNALLGGYFSSRITLNIREDKGYTYSPFSQLSNRYRDAYWLQSADVTTAHTADSLREIFNEIEELRSAAPSEAELDGVKNYMTGIFVLRNSSPINIIAQLRFIDLHGLPEDYLNAYVTRLNALTPADIQAMAKEYLVPERMTTVIVGDPGAVSAQLENTRILH